MKINLVLKTSLLLVFLVCILGISCTPEERFEDFRVTSPEFQNGIFIVHRAQGSTASFKITTNQAAKFFRSITTNGINIQESGDGATTGLGTQLTWVEVEPRSRRGTRLKLPVLITNRADEYKKVINGLADFHNHTDELVLVLRHVDAYEGSDQVDSGIEGWWMSCDSQKARQVSEAGKVNAKSIGNALKRMNVPTGIGLSSEFCRAVQTLEYMELGLDIQKYKILNHPFSNDVLEVFPGVVEVVADYITSSELLLVAGHGNLLAGRPDFVNVENFDMSDGFILRKNTQGTMEFVGTMPMMLWEAFIYSDFLP